MDGGISDLYLNFNVLNNKVFETGCDDNGWEFKDSDRVN